MGIFKDIKTDELEKIEEQIKDRLFNIKNCPLKVRRLHYLIKAELLGRETEKRQKKGK